MMKWHYSIVNNTVPSNTESPAFTLIDAIFPSNPACMEFSIFMASNIITVSAAFTMSPAFALIDNIVPGSGAVTCFDAPAACGLLTIFSPVDVRGTAEGRGAETTFRCLFVF